MRAGMLFVTVKGTVRLTGTDIELSYQLSYRMESVDHGLTRVWRVDDDGHKELAFGFDYSNALVSVINDCNRLGVDVTSLDVE